MTSKEMVTTKQCGTCRHSYCNSTAVLSRLGCWKGHVWWFALAHDLECKGKDWEPKIMTDDRPSKTLVTYEMDRGSNRQAEIPH